MMCLTRSPTCAIAAALVLGAALVATGSPAAALSYDVTQEGVSLGTIVPFSGAGSAADFYQFGVPHAYSGAPIGVPLSGDSSVLFIYVDTSTGVYSLGWIHGKEGEGPLRLLSGIVEITPDANSPSVLVSDDPGSLRLNDEEHLLPGLDEFAADPNAPGTFTGTWRWGPNRTDGGMVGPIGTTSEVGGATATITLLDGNSEPVNWMVA